MFRQWNFTLKSGWMSNGNWALQGYAGIIAFWWFIDNDWKKKIRNGQLRIV